MIEIYVNDRLVDLPKSNLDLGIDYAIFDVNSIGNRQGVRSYSLDLPLTNNNKQIFESSEMITNTGSLPYTKIKARILVDGIDILIRFCTLKQAGSKFKCEFYGGNTDLFSAIRDRKCIDADMCEYDHYWNLLPVAESIYNTDGYIYALIDYHTDSPNAYIDNTSRVVRVDFMPACIYMNSLLEAIIQDTGYSFDNELATESSNVLISNGDELESSLTICDRYNGVFTMDADKNITATATFVNKFFDFDTVSDVFGLYYRLPYQSEYYPPSLPSTLVSCIHFQDAISFDVSFSLDFKNDYAIPMIATVLFELRELDGTPINSSIIVPEQSLTSVYNCPVGNSTYTQTFRISNEQFERFNLILKIEGNSLSFPALTLLKTSTVTVSNAVSNKRINTGYLDYISCASLAPKISQSNFLKSYLQMFFGLPVVNNITNTFHIVKFSKLLANIGSALDWTNKIDLSQVGEISYIIDQYAKRNNFVYTEDGNEMKPIGTDGFITISNENLEDSADIVELPYAATNFVLRLVDNRIDNIGIFKDGEYNDARVPRVLRKYGKSVTDMGGTLDYTDGTYTVYFSGGEIIPLTYFIQEGSTDNLGFGDNLLSTYYDLIESILNKSKILTLPVRLNSSDINQLDFTIPIYLQQYESYFYINKIEGYSPNSNTSCSVELVKLNL